MTRTIVDSSVFIDFFRGKELPQLETLIQNNLVILSPYVKLELLQGVRKSELKALNEVLEGLLTLPIDPLKFFADAELILSAMKDSGVNLGVVDLLIAAEARFHKCKIYSFDKVFEKLAEQSLVELA